MKRIIFYEIEYRYINKYFNSYLFHRSTWKHVQAYKVCDIIRISSRDKHVHVAMMVSS